MIENDLKVKGSPNNDKNILSVIPNLYLKLRERAIRFYNYDEANGMLFQHAKNMAMDIVGWYGYKTSFFESDDMDLVKQLVDSDIPSLVASYNSIKYGNHSMVVNGYIKLEKTTGWWIFTSTDRKWLLSVDDGHQDSCENGGENERRFYDPNKKGGAKFICAEKNTLDYSLC